MADIQDMKEQAIKMVEQMTAEGAILQLHSPSGQHDMDDIEAIEAIQMTRDTIRISDSTIIFGDGQVCITVEGGKYQWLTSSCPYS